jgi:hypothetical protein
MFFTRWSGQRIGNRLIFCRKVRPCSQLHRPDTEASQIAEVHLSNRIFQDEGRVRDGEHIVGADSTLHYPAFLPPGRICAESFQDTSGCGSTNRPAHHESLQTQVIVHRDLYVLLRAQIALGRLDRERQRRTQRARRLRWVTATKKSSQFQWTSRRRGDSRMVLPHSSR